MKNITQFNRPSIKAIRTAMDEAMSKVEKEFGIKISTGNASFSDNEVTFKVKANTLDGNTGEVISKEAVAFESRKGVYGLDHLSVGDKIEMQGKTFTIAGLNTRARKSPINIIDANGTSYKCSIEMIKRNS